MDRRLTAWLDQAQWGPGQRQKPQTQMAVDPAQYKAPNGLEILLRFRCKCESGEKTTKTEYISLPSSDMAYSSLVVQKL